MTAVNSNLKKNATGTAASIDNIKQDINALKADVIDLSRNVKTDGMKKIEEATIELSDKIDSLKKEGNYELDRVNAYISDRPTQSVAIAFAIGALFATIFTGRR